MIKTLCSNGERISDATVQRRYSAMIRAKHEGQLNTLCEGCLQARAVHNDHTIAKARCKVIHKTELIYDPLNIVNSCQRCHDEWEAFKSGNYLLHKNSEQRLRYLKEHDPEGFNIRIELTVGGLEEEVYNLQEATNEERRQEKTTTEGNRGSDC